MKSESKIFPGLEFNCCQKGCKPSVICNPDEAVLRNIASGRLKDAMTKEQRAWCINQAGNYFENELESLDDRALAESVLRAWNMNKETL